MNTSENIDKLAPALLAAQKAIKWAVRDAKNPHFNSEFASLPAVIDAVKEPLNAAGIVYVQTPSKCDDGRLHLTTRLIHESGQWIQDTAVCPLQKQDPQGYGSAIKYLRRYSLGAITGLYDTDDDGNAACEPPKTAAKPKATTPPAAPAKATHEQVKEICDMYVQNPEYAGRIQSALAHYKVQNTGDLTEADAAKIIAALKKPAPKPAAK